ncbi:hypothetical protein Syun_010411 [Stephania yunnanensis]|uniref:Uncharacterized protein n=1 Tax=Stephania yunnanensis TaxID=152371 RepID=A0AAP0KIR9_9MAGN
MNSFYFRTVKGLLDLLLCAFSMEVSCSILVFFVHFKCSACLSIPNMNQLFILF